MPKEKREKKKSALEAAIFSKYTIYMNSIKYSLSLAERKRSELGVPRAMMSAI